MSVSKQRIYVAGGFGIKTGRAVREPVDVTYIDTSDANRIDELDPNSVYRIPGVKGAGQDRRKIYSVILPHVNDIIEAHPPAEFNIVVFSSSGGSGSVAGPLLVRALLKKGCSVVAITVGDLSTSKYMKNTRDTMKGFESMALSLDHPVAVAYFQNSEGVPQNVIDDEVQFYISSLLTLANQENDDIDIQDVSNWINYTNVTGHPAQLANFTIHDTRQSAISVLEPVTTLSLYANRADYSMIGNPMYGKNGTPRETVTTNFDQLHFVLNTITVSDIMREINDAVVRQDQRVSGYRNRTSIVDVRNDNISDDDMVFE